MRLAQHTRTSQAVGSSRAQRVAMGITVQRTAFKEALCLGT